MKEDNIIHLFMGKKEITLKDGRVGKIIKIEETREEEPIIGFNCKTIGYIISKAKKEVTLLIDGKEETFNIDVLMKLIKTEENKMKTNIKMRVTPEQSEKVQKIIKGDILDITLSYPFLYLTEEDGLQHGSSEEIFENDETEEISSELFIRTNGTCEETKTEENKLEWIEYNGHQDLEEERSYLFCWYDQSITVDKIRKGDTHRSKEGFKSRIIAYMELPKPYEKPKSLKERLDEAVESYCYKFSDEEWENSEMRKICIHYSHISKKFEIETRYAREIFSPYYFLDLFRAEAFIYHFTTDELMQIMKGEVK